MAICSTTSYPFGFPSISKRPLIDILKLIVTKLKNKDKRVSSIQVDKDGALSIYSKFMEKCHNMNTIVQTTGEYESSLNGESEIPNKTLDNTTRALLLNSSDKKEIWFLSYQYVIWISWQTDNRLHGNVTYLLWNWSRPTYKHIKVWGVILCIINGRVTRKNRDNISIHGYFMGYAATIGVIIYWNPHPNFLST